MNLEPDKDESSPERLNYFNYFTEIEDEFVRRRGSHMLISPMDWALVESWKEAGIPATVVIRAINRAFDGYESRPRKFSKVNSILYCQQAVEEEYAEYRQSRVGSDSESNGEPSADKEPDKAESSFSATALLDFLDRCIAEMSSAKDHFSSVETGDFSTGPVIEVMERALVRLASIREAISGGKSVNAEAVESDLNSTDKMLMETVRTACSAETIESLSKEAKAELRGYKSKMDKEIYKKTLDNFTSRRLRELARIPRLSLFYLF